MEKVMTVEDFINKLRLVKDKKQEIAFKSGKFILPVTGVVAVIKNKDVVTLPQIDEKANAVLVQLAITPIDMPKTTPVTETVIAPGE